MEIDDRLCETEVLVLREMNGERTGMVAGAAMWACASRLKSLGYASGYYDINEKGKAYLAFLDSLQGKEKP